MTEQVDERRKPTIADMRVETWQHIYTVQRFILKAIEEFHRRMLAHDQSKLHGVEAEILQEYTGKLKGMTYGSPEYTQALKEMKPMIDNHYKHNSHHPEHYERGINGMNLFDMLEMVLDWKAATLRHDDGDIRKSLQINKERFGIDQQVLDIMENTVDWIEKNINV